VSERQVSQETVSVIQPTEDKCRNEGMEDVRNDECYVTDARLQSSEMLSVVRGSSSSDLDR